MPDDWEWGFLPLSSTNPPTKEAKDRFPRIEADRRGPCRKRPLDQVDPDPYIHWTDLKMGRTHTSRPGNFSSEAPGSSDDLTVLENKAPAPDAGSSQAPPAKRFRTEAFAGKVAGKRRYKGKMMPVSSGPALTLSKSASGTKPEGPEGTARASTPPPQSSPVPTGTGNPYASPLGGTSSAGRAAPTLPEHRVEEDLISPPEKQDIGASNIGADEEAAGRAEPLVPPVPKRKKKKKTKESSPSKPMPDPSAPASSTLGQDAPDARSPRRTSSAPPPEAPSAEPTGTTPTPPLEVLKITKFLKPEALKGKATASGTSSAGPRSLVLHAGPAAVAAGEKPSGILGRITELKREGRELGLLPYAEKWNTADVSAATRGLGKDRLPAPDPAGPRCTEEHYIRLRRASTAFARKHLFEELLWEHRDLAEAHNKCQAIPEASIEALKTQLTALQGEKEQLIREHREALDAQETYSKELKEQLIQLGLEHNKAMKAAQAAAEDKLNEALEDANNSTVVLQAELEEGDKARKAAEDHAARLEGEQKEYDLLVMQTDGLALRLFPDSQAYAQKKVADRRIAQAYKNLDAPWDPYDHLVALSARVSHMRAVDRNLADLPEVAIHLFKWQCSAARAGADAALRVACSWYPDLDLDALIGVRENAPTDMDPVLTAKRQDRAYRIAEYASVRTFIPPPPDVRDLLSRISAPAAHRIWRRR
ncbi:hypothetical protein QYE76_028773 [Lolium multiflorum]|uniref:Uncharacterized protein n=1 Tax=Lolium multiflorum TaxID=4521 RepID=A0AAD8QLJ9_LOLMU|nr:hypothetical protein QYE76_028773 [Lolium multiflorum]